jgi:hypothetical protein
MNTAAGTIGPPLGTNSAPSLKTRTIISANCVPRSASGKSRPAGNAAACFHSPFTLTSTAVTLGLTRLAQVWANFGQNSFTGPSKMRQASRLRTASDDDTTVGLLIPKLGDHDR